MADNNDDGDDDMVCCGTIKGCVKTIARLQIVFNLLGSIGTFIGMITAAPLVWYTGYEMFFLWVIGLDYFIIGIYFGIVLLQGANSVNVDDIKRWRRYQVICLVCYLHVFIIGTMLFSSLFLLMILPVLWARRVIMIVDSFVVKSENRNVNGGSGQRRIPTATSTRTATTPARTVTKQMPKVHYTKNQLPSQAVSLNTVFPESV